MKKDAIISIAAGHSQEDLIKKIKKRGLAVIGVDKNPNAAGFKFCDEHIVASTHDSKAIIEALEKLKNKWNFVGIVVQSSGAPGITASEVAQRFNLRFVLPDIAQTALNKNLLIQELNKKGVPAPAICIASKNKIPTINFPPPYFVKPSRTAQTHTAMMKIDSRSELTDAIKCAAEISDTGQVNIEEYVSGVDILSIDWVWNKKIIHVATLEEISSGPPNFYGLGWKIPVSGKTDNVVAGVQKQCVEVLGVNNSLIEIGMKYDGVTARVFEVGLDLGGDGAPDVLLPQSLNYDLFEDGINVALGETPLGPRKIATPSYLRFLLQSEMKEGKEKTLEEIKNKFGGSNVEFKELPAKMNDEFRVAAVLLQAGTVPELDLKINEFEKWLKTK